jgi:hypothetical protein
MRGSRRPTAVLAGFPVAILAGLVLAGAPAVASSGGRVQRSGKQGPTCNECHTGGTRPDVAVEMPAVVHVSETVTIRFTVHAGSPAGKAAGFNVAVEGGSLVPIPGQGTHLSIGELTHDDPQGNDDTRTAGWDFQWIAPAVAGRYRIWGAGNSVNLNGQNTGDRSNATVVRVDVVAAVGSPRATPTATSPPTTATPSPTPTDSSTPEPSGTDGATATPSSPPNPTDTASATPTPTPALTVTDTPSPTATPFVIPCPGDCNGDGQVAINEIVTAVSIALGDRDLSVCPSIDLNSDGAVTINELIIDVTNALNAC